MRAFSSLAAAGLCAAAATAVTASAAEAHPIRPDDDRILIVDDRRPPPPPPLPKPPPEKKPREPLVTSLGFRLGAAFGGPTPGFTYGLHGGLVLHRSLRATLEYEHVVLTGDDEEEPMPGAPHLVEGRAHRARLGVRLTLVDSTVKDVLRLYADADVTGGLALVSGPRMDTALQPDATAGLRLGYELLSRDHPSPSRAFDFNLVLRMQRTGSETGFGFGIGMEWIQ